jgi:pre-mRNA-processing factor SLU7
MKECLSRPRKKGARWTGKDIQADEVVQTVELGYDAKRDRWNGYDADEYQRIIDEYNEVEAMKKLAQAKEDGQVEDGDIYEAEADMGRQQSTSTRNLRLREDKAKYLMDLDPDSAKYDPKTRSMVDAGGGGSSGHDADDGFLRQGDETEEFEKAQRYAWETQGRGDASKIHLQANPTAAMLAIKKEKEESQARQEAQKKALLEKYGGQDTVRSPPVHTRVTANESFVEYDESGGIKGAPKVKPKSKYPEDVFINNHTSVWGSWWKDFKWGYACCHSTVKNSYCTGEEGKAAYDEAEQRRLGEEQQDDDVDMPQTAVGETSDRKADVAGDWSRKPESGVKGGERGKRTLDMMRDGVTEEEMEEYRKKRAFASDPMAAHLGKDEVIE